MPSSRTMTLAVTVGDPNGIGPEVVIKALVNTPWPDDVVFRIYGPEQAMRVWHRAWCHRPWPEQVTWEDQPWNPSGNQWGRPTPEAGHYVYRLLDRAVEDLKAGRVDALVTAPIIKKSLVLAGYDLWDHTTFLAHRFHCTTVMSMITPRLRVAFVTAHVPLARVPQLVTPERVIETIALVDRELRDRFGLPEPRLALCSMNPHAGEQGTYGREEIEVLQPAVARLQESGIRVVGPAPPETLFRQMRAGAYDLIVALYHDQGMIPVKLSAFGSAVNYTMGLPIIRTSPDHGAGLDIAGRNQAREEGLVAAIRLALELARRQRTLQASG